MEVWLPGVEITFGADSKEAEAVEGQSKLGPGEAVSGMPEERQQTSVCPHSHCLMAD